MNDDRPFTDAELIGLAATQLERYCARRSQGNDISVTLDAFAPADRVLIQELYTRLDQLFRLIQPYVHAPPQALDPLTLVPQFDWSQFLRRLVALGQATPRFAQPSLADRVIHDVRGGAFQALSVQLQLMQAGVLRPDDLTRLFFLTRDHLKIMRNAVRDLDRVAYERDCIEMQHDVRLLIKKWHGATHRTGVHAAEVSIDCRFTGSVCKCCLEFAALDRMLYNLMNNAVRHAADGRISLTILSLDASDVRFVIVNVLDEAQRSRLTQGIGNRLSDLFRGGFTTGGMGLGMRICADFVANAYGLSSFAEAITGGYIGARLLGSRFVGWFHWPIASS